jgi:hypothetical protein
MELRPDVTHGRLYEAGAAFGKTRRAECF